MESYEGEALGVKMRVGQAKMLKGQGPVEKSVQRRLTRVGSRRESLSLSLLLITSKQQKCMCS